MKHKRKHKSRRRVVDNPSKPVPSSPAAGEFVKTCEHCGKLAYTSRRKAKARARAAFPGHHLSPYPCNGHWHVGHLPSRVIAGDRDRAELRDR